MTTPKHTPEPWDAISDSVMGTLVRSEGLILAKMRTIQGIDHEANAARIVACVNACKGFTEEELETLGHYKAFHDTIIAENEQLRKELSKLKGDSNG